MPFTFSHPSMILPILRQRYLCPAALVLGTVVPDIGYFLQLPTSANRFAHSILGIFFFSLPIGIALFSFLCLVREEIARTLPPRFRQLFEQLKLLDLSWRSWSIASVVFSLVVGSATHCFVDSFTHEWGFLVERSTTLTELITTPFGELPLYYLLQYTFSIVGFVALITYIVYFLTRDRSIRDAFFDVQDSWYHALWVALIASPVCIGLVSEIVIYFRDYSTDFNGFIFGFLTKTIGSFFVIYALIVLFLRINPKSRALLKPRP